MEHVAPLERAGTPRDRPANHNHIATPDPSPGSVDGTLLDLIERARSARFPSLAAGTGRVRRASWSASPGSTTTSSTASSMIVGSVDDPAERHADATAERIREVLDGGSGPMQLQRSPSPSRIRRSFMSAATQSVPMGPEGGPVPEATAGRIRASVGRPLPNDVRGPMEHAFGRDLSRVRLHDESHVAAEIGARAFTMGNDIHVGVGEPGPGTASGTHLLAHELAHVVQEGGSGSIHRLYTLVDTTTREEIPQDRIATLHNRYGDYLNDGNDDLSEREQFEWMRDEYHRQWSDRQVAVTDNVVQFTLGEKDYEFVLEPVEEEKVMRIVAVLQQQYLAMKSGGAAKGAAIGPPSPKGTPPGGPPPPPGGPPAPPGKVPATAKGPPTPPGGPPPPPSGPPAPTGPVATAAGPPPPAAQSTGPRIRLGSAAQEKKLEHRKMTRVMPGAIASSALPQAQTALALIARELGRSGAYRDMLAKIVDEPGAAIPLLFGKHSAGAFDNWEVGGVDIDDFDLLPDDPVMDPENPTAGGAKLTKGDIMMHVLEERYYMERKGMSYVEAHYKCLAPDSFQNRFRKERGIPTRLVELDECEPHTKTYKTLKDVRHGTFVATDIEGYQSAFEDFMSGKASILEESHVEWDLKNDPPKKQERQVDAGAYFGKRFDLALADYIANKATKPPGVAAAEAQLRHWASTIQGKVPDAVIASADAESAAVKAELKQIKDINDNDRLVDDLTKEVAGLRQLKDLSADQSYLDWSAQYDTQATENERKAFIARSKADGGLDVASFERFHKASAQGGKDAALMNTQQRLAAAVLATAPLIQAWYAGDNFFANGRRASEALKSLPWYREEVAKSLEIRKRAGVDRANTERGAADQHLAATPTDEASKALADLRAHRGAHGVPAAFAVNDAEPGHATLNCSFVSIAAVFGNRTDTGAAATSGWVADKWAESQGSSHKLSGHQDENAWYVGQNKLDPANFAPPASKKAEIGDVQWAGIATFLRTLPQVGTKQAVVEVVGEPDVGKMTDEATTVNTMNIYPNGSQFVVFLFQQGMSGGHYVYAERYNDRIVFEDYQWNRRDTPTDPIRPRTAYVDKFPNKAITNEPDLYTEGCFVAVKPVAPTR